MINTSELTTTANELNGMEERWKWYLAGAIDTAGQIDVKVAKDERYKINYFIKPQIALTRTSNFDIIIGMLDDYCDGNSVHYRISEHGDSKRFEIDNIDSVIAFLEPLYPRLVQQAEFARIILEEIAPAIKEGKHTSKDGFLEIMKHVEELRTHLPKARRESKYDLEYFEDLWSE